MIWFSFKNSILKYLTYVVYSLPSHTNGSSFVLNTYLCSMGVSILCWRELNILSWTWVFQRLGFWPLLWAITNAGCLSCWSLCSLSPSVWALTAWSAIAQRVRWVFCFVVFISHLFLFPFELVPRALLCHVGLAWSSPIWNKNILPEAWLRILLHCQKLPSKQINKSNKQCFPEAPPQSWC